MFRKLIDRLFGEDVQEEVDHEEVERQINEHYEERRLDFDCADEYPYDHYTDATENIKQLKREKNHDEAENLLLWCIDYVEQEATHHEETSGAPWSIAPWYYKHLAIVYRKDGRYTDEVAVPERYHDAYDKIGHEVTEELTDRLARARELAEEGE